MCGDFQKLPLMAESVSTVRRPGAGARRKAVGRHCG